MAERRESTGRALQIAKALADATRFELFRTIAARPGICCSDLVALFPVAQATISHHLKILSDAGLVAARREGPFGYYRVRPETVAEFGRLLHGAVARRQARPPAGRNGRQAGARVAKAPKGDAAARGASVLPSRRGITTTQGEEA